MVVVFSTLQHVCFGQHCSSGCSSARHFFGQVHLARSHIACVAFVDFGNCDWLAVGLSAPDAVASVTAGGEFAGRAQAAGLRFSASSSAVQRRRHPARLTSRSSRPRVVASATCYALRLHASAAPPQGGLTQALGGKKHSAVALSALPLIGFGQHCSSDGSWARCFFGQVRNARSQFACVALAGFGSYVYFRLVTQLQMHSLLTGPADSFRGALRRPGFGFRQVRWGFSFAGIRPA